jgi:hypothetical protein
MPPKKTVKAKKKKKKTAGNLSRNCFQKVEYVFLNMVQSLGDLVCV